MTKSKCLSCGRASEITHGPEKLRPGEKQPKPGDFAICCYCNRIGILLETNSDLKPLNADELFNLYVKDEALYFALIQAQQAIDKIRNAFKKRL